DTMGIIGGYFTGVMLLGLNAGVYLDQIQVGVDTKDVMGGFLKALIFAVMVSTICSFQGYFTHMRAGVHGAKSVSLSTTAAVVLSCVVVLVGDYVITSFLI
ncbi:MAG: ABC transporter permease, partial [Candidatus Binatia bacterium]|nr:ABC transporter permease [Candidatus Binatia bacterium]